MQKEEVKVESNETAIVEYEKFMNDQTGKRKEEFILKLELGKMIASGATLLLSVCNDISTTLPKQNESEEFLELLKALNNNILQLVKSMETISDSLKQDILETLSNIHSLINWLKSLKIEKLEVRKTKKWTMDIYTALLDIKEAYDLFLSFYPANTSPGMRHMTTISSPLINKISLEDRILPTSSASSSSSNLSTQISSKSGILNVAEHLIYTTSFVFTLVEKTVQKDLDNPLVQQNLLKPLKMAEKSTKSFQLFLSSLPIPSFSSLSSSNSQNLNASFHSLDSKDQKRFQVEANIWIKHLTTFSSQAKIVSKEYSFGKSILSGLQSLTRTTKQFVLLLKSLHADKQ